MPKSVRTQLIEAVEASLHKIKAGNAVPNLSSSAAHKFLSTPRTISRTLRALEEHEFPGLFVVDPTENGRHMLADILQQTLQITVAGSVLSKDVGQNPALPAIVQLDNMLDDVRALLVSDPTWGGLARRSRLPKVEADTSTSDTLLAFGAVYEIDYIEVVDSDSGSQALPAELPLTNMPYGESVYNALFNALLTIPGIKWVERARNWPMPLEQISARYTPGIWFKGTNEAYQYFGSTDALKQVYGTIMLIAVDLNAATFTSTLDTWIARLKDCLGTPAADLKGRVASVDIVSIRTDRSEYPVVLIELDLLIKYMQSFTIS